MMFDAFVMVDWSAATVPRTGRDRVCIQSVTPLLRLNAKSAPVAG